MKGVVGAQNLCQVHVVLAYGNSLEVIGWLFPKLLPYDVGDETRVKFWKHVVVWGLYS